MIKLKTLPSFRLCVILFVAFSACADRAQKRRLPLYDPGEDKSVQGVAISDSTNPWFPYAPPVLVVVGWQKIADARYETLDRHYHVNVTGTDEFWVPRRELIQVADSCIAGFLHDTAAVRASIRPHGSGRNNLLDDALMLGDSWPTLVRNYVGVAFDGRRMVLCDIHPQVTPASSLAYHMPRTSVLFDPENGACYITHLRERP